MTYRKEQKLTLEGTGAIRRCLDSSANVYPAIATREYPQVYRLTVILVTKISPEYLKQAVRETLPFFPAFSVLLKKERFWYCLEQTSVLPEIRKRTAEQTQPFSPSELQFRFLYEQDRIHLEAFHVLTDGCGAMHFFHAVCYRYCQLAYSGMLSANVLAGRYGLIGRNQLQDGYLKISEEKGSFWKLLKRRRPFRISEQQRNEKLKQAADAVTMRIPLAGFKKICREYQVTVCEMLTAICMYCLWKEYGKQAARCNRPLRIAVPVDLRPIFQEVTESNFFTCISIDAEPDKAYSLELLIQDVREQFKEKCRKEYLREQVAGQVSGQNAMVSRYAPLSVKNWFLNRVYRFNGYSTTVLSNLGCLLPAKEFAPFIKGYRCVLPVTEKEPVKMAVCSYGEEMDLTIVNSLGDNRLCRRIDEVFQAFGICLEMERDKSEEVEPRRYGLGRTGNVLHGDFEYTGAGTQNPGPGTIPAA